ncbi:Arm DNA-binding domain-containing protein [Mucilaginibacter polytrichastri]|uniref:Arm DNA-binding domain-containing protein n=1 Tax=Mucilaginibacter polytrichastri TaxID=1302689 RepID=UPI0009431D59|nr:Arm DNA-binding domain-containing protein [Mucilaginibacter polytrichastri]
MLLFYLKKPKYYEQGPIPVYLRITVDGLEKDLSTKRAWEPSRWNNKSNRSSGTKEDSSSLKEYLDVLQNKVYDARKYLIDWGKIVTAGEIRNLAGY